nr:major facilitator superfamily domain-containing protein 12-like [Quercus suber]
MTCNSKVWGYLGILNYNNYLLLLCRSRVRAQGNFHVRIAWAFWFKRVLYYEVAIVYVLARLIVNVSQAYLAFYVINDLRMAQSAKALVPAIIYTCSFIVSVILQEIAWTGQRLKAYDTAGGIIWMFSGAAIIFLPRSTSAFMYIISIFIGVANALMMVTGISMQNVLIGENLGGCAFVCGSLSFLDKISCGLALYVLQSFQSCSPELQRTNAIDVYISVTRFGLGLLPSFCAVIGVAVTYSMKLHTPFSKPIMEPLLE